MNTPRFRAGAICLAGSCLFAPAIAPAHGAITTKVFSTVVDSFGTPDPDGAFYPIGTPATIAIKFDSGMTYMGGAGSATDTIVTIPAGLSVTVGSDVFTADTYKIQFINPGPSNNFAIVDFRTTDFISSFPVLRNGQPFAGSLPGHMQFTFFLNRSFVPLPVTPGLAFSIPPFIAEGLVRETSPSSAHEYFFRQGTWQEIPSPGAASLAVAACLAMSRRRTKA